MQNFHDKVVVITGAGSGIGRELALAWAGEGARLLLLDRDVPAVERTANAATKMGGQALAKACDVADAAAVQAAADFAYDQFGHVHILVNNAGVLTGGPIWRTPLPDWRTAFDVNVMGIAHALHSFIPRMIAAGEPAHVLNTASAGGLISVGGFGVYSASKQAVVAISETLHRDLLTAGADHIGVSVLCPAFVKTNITETQENSAFAKGEDATAFREATRKACENTRLSAVDVARIALDGVRAGQFYILSHAGTRTVVKARMTDILENRLPTDPMKI